MRIAVYGGSFNPPHNGHTGAARAAVTALKTDKLIFVPAASPPHKALPEGSPDACERLLLTKLAASDIPCAEVSDIELARGGESYTVETLETIAREHPGADIFLLMGTDMLESFESWYRFGRILELCALVPVARSEGDEPRLTASCAGMKEKYAAKTIIIEKRPLDISSTRLREELAKGGGREYLNPEVYSRIIQKRLYGALPDLAWLREQAYAMLDAKRVPHVRGTESEAVSLARRWGCSGRDAAEAAILHDITKKLSHDEQLILCREYGIIIDGIEAETAKLLHAKTGAALSKALFGSPDDIYNAILYHTTGRGNMTTLEKIIYLADYIEPNRRFDGICELRRLAYEDIDAAMILGLRMSIEDIKANGGKIHSRTLETLGSLAAKEVGQQ